MANSKAKNEDKESGRKNGNGKCLDLSALESWLWEAANILRGPVDAADFKTFIFPLLFFKRVSDVFDEGFEQALQESAGDIAYAQFAENHRFQIPEGCHWNDVRSKSTNIGQAIQRALREIEKANPNVKAQSAARQSPVHQRSQRCHPRACAELPGRGAHSEDFQDLSEVCRDR